MEVDIDVDIDTYNQALRLRREACLLPEIEPGPGWYGSSQALRRGLDIIECGARPAEEDEANPVRMFGR